MAPVRIIVVLAALALLAAGSVSAAGAPRIALEQVSPVVVVGSGFMPSSNVRVTVTGNGLRLAKTVLATKTGTVTAHWQRTLRIDGCHTGVVTAVGSDGRQASWKPVHAKTCGAIRQHDPINPIDPGK